MNYSPDTNLLNEESGPKRRFFHCWTNGIFEEAC